MDGQAGRAGLGAGGGGDEPAGDRGGGVRQRPPARTRRADHRLAIERGGLGGGAARSAVGAAGGLEAPELRKLFSFYDEIRKRTGAEPSLADLERLLRIHVRLESVAQVERLNAMVRDSGLDTKTCWRRLGKT